jgi:predicted nucleic-acid-binding Zn-ribbon protein
MMMFMGWACFLGGVLAGLLLGSFLKAKCVHDWEPVVERELPSRAEELKKNGEDLTTWRLPSQLMEIASKTFFAIVSCKKCGGIKEFQTKT